ncbi:MAG: amidohydrolase [Chloroflexi bacterium]|nr:amidohydrolase [Chloroflexota bacterium]
MTEARIPAIDAWAQPGTAALLNRPEFASLFRATGETARFEGVPVEELLANMDQAGTERAVLRAWCAPDGWIISNDEIAEIVARHPKRFLGLATVDLLRPVEAVRELERAVKDLGLSGLFILPWMWDLPPNDRHYYPLYVKCIELGVPFCCQVGHTGPLRRSEPGRPIPYLDDVALTFPDLTIVGGHIGHPWTDEMIGLAWKYPNVYIDTSAYLPRYYPPALVHFMNSYGQDKVLWGTNYPMLPVGRCREQVEDLGLKPEAKEKFLRLNAQRVFKLAE